MKVIPRKSFLVRQEDVEGGKKKDVCAQKGVKIEMTEKEAIKFWGALALTDQEKKRLNAVAKDRGYKRSV